jgi:TonB family protein
MIFSYQKNNFFNKTPMKKIISIAVFVFAGIILSAQTTDSSSTSPEKITQVAVVDSTVSNRPDTSAPFVFVDVMPAFPGSPDAFQKYLSENIKYPKMEKEKNREGAVWIAFTVELDGSITDVHAVKEVAGAPGLTQEAIRVISEMPKWTPGTLNGRTVRVTMTQSIRFVLENGRKKRH